MQASSTLIIKDGAFTHVVKHLGGNSFMTVGGSMVMGMTERALTEALRMIECISQHMFWEVNLNDGTVKGMLKRQVVVRHKPIHQVKASTKPQVAAKQVKKVLATYRRGV